MNWLSLVGNLFKVFMLVWQQKLARDKERAEELAVAEAEVREGLATRDPGMITAGFDRARNA